MSFAQAAVDLPQEDIDLLVERDVSFSCPNVVAYLVAAPKGLPDLLLGEAVAVAPESIHDSPEAAFSARGRPSSGESRISVCQRSNVMALMAVIGSCRQPTGALPAVVRDERENVGAGELVAPSQGTPAPQRRRRPRPALPGARSALSPRRRCRP